MLRDKGRSITAKKHLYPGEAAINKTEVLDSIPPTVIGPDVTVALGLIPLT